MSDISVLTLVKNRSSHLNRLIEGLRRSTVAPLELIVLDMSDTAAAIEPAPDFPINTVRLFTEGLPLAQARNVAARHARGARLLFLDVDCIPSASLVSRMDRELVEHDSLICAPVGYLGPGDVDDEWSEASLAAHAQDHPVREFPRSGLRTETNAGLFWSLTFGIRKSTFEALGGFDEAFTGYGAEDTDFGFRARDAGLPLLFMSGPGSFHQHHDVFDPPLQHFDDIVRNARLFHQRWGIWPMEGWLKAFEAQGLIALNGQTLTRKRGPTVEEIAHARRFSGARF